MGWIKNLHDLRKKREFKLDLLFTLIATTIFMMVVDLCMIIVAKLGSLNNLVWIGLILLGVFLTVAAILHFKVRKEIVALDELYLTIEGSNGNKELSD